MQSFKSYLDICTLFSYLSQGVEAILNHGQSRSVVSMSLSGAYGHLPSFTQMADKLFEAGYLLSHAAGNFNDDACNYSPQMQWHHVSSTLFTTG